MSAVRGFTLLEMMITIAIAAILLTIGVPSLRSLLLSSSRGEASNSLYGALILARGEAITRNAVISICQRNYSTTNAFPSCGGSTGWKNGWIVYQDSNSSNTGNKPLAAADIIAVGDPTDAAFTITPSPAGTGLLQFDAAGRVSGSAGQVNFYLCKADDNTFQGSSILVELNGRVALTTYNCAT